MKRPLTRSVLETQIAEAQTRVDDAVTRHAYAECPPLQDKLNALVAKRELYPTMIELEEAVSSAESAMADAGEFACVLHKMVLLVRVSLGFGCF